MRSLERGFDPAGPARVIAAALVVALASVFLGPATAHGDLDGAATLSVPASTLIMPFDNTGNRVSFQTVTNLAQEPPFVAVRWSYWAEDGRHLADAFTCLSQGDSKVMDPRSVADETQHPNPPRNVSFGAPKDLSGERGVVILTALEAETGANFPLSGCDVTDRSALPSGIVGSWVIADTSTNAAFGAGAVGTDPSTFPDATIEFGVDVPTFDPDTLDDSTVILLTAEVATFDAPFAGVEFIRPIQRDRSNGYHMCCNVTFVAAETERPLPEVCLEAAAFRPISAAQAEGDESPLIPPNETISAPGMLRVDDCAVANDEGETEELGTSLDQFLFVIHGQAIGPFGMVIHGKYIGSAGD